MQIYPRCRVINLLILDCLAAGKQSCFSLTLYFNVFSDFSQQKGNGEKKGHLESTLQIHPSLCFTLNLPENLEFQRDLTFQLKRPLEDRNNPCSPFYEGKNCIDFSSIVILILDAMNANYGNFFMQNILLQTGDSCIFEWLNAPRGSAADINGKNCKSSTEARSPP